MPQIFLRKEQLIYAATRFLQEMLINKNTSISQLYQSPRTAFSQNTYHRLLSSCEYCKVFKNSFFIEHLQKQSFADIPQNR